MSYVGGTAATALDSADGSSSYGLSTGSGNDYYLELDDHTTETGTITSVRVRAVLRADQSSTTIDFRIGLQTNGSSYFSSTQSHSTTSYSTYSGSTYGG